VIPLNDSKQVMGLEARQVYQGQAGANAHTIKKYARDLNSVFASYQIADTAIYLCGRNPARVEDTMIYRDGRNSVSRNYIIFDLVKPIIRGPALLLKRNALGQFVTQVNKAA
jgi:hypothetical protein